MTFVTFYCSRPLGVRVSSGELCVPLVQVRRHADVFYCLKCFFCVVINSVSWLQGHHRWRGVCRWAEDDLSLLCFSDRPPSSEGDAQTLYVRAANVKPGFALTHSFLFLCRLIFLLCSQTKWWKLHWSTLKLLWKLKKKVRVFTDSSFDIF